MKKEFSIELSWEAIYDIAEIADYIDIYFGSERAIRFEEEIKEELTKLKYTGTIFGKTQLLYRGYYIQKKPFPPSIIFYVIDSTKDTVFILRILREERDWEALLNCHPTYSFE